MKKNPHVLALVDKYRYRKGLTITDEKSTFYKIFKIIYIISIIWTFVFNGLFLIGNLVSLEFAEVKIKTTPAITQLIATLLLIIGFVLILKKIYIAGGILNILSTVMGTVQYYTLLLNDIQLNGGIKHFFFWRHFAPAVVLIITCVVLCYIGIKAKILLNRDYKKMLERLYIKNKDKLVDTSDEGWQELLENGELFDDSKYKE